MATGDVTDIKARLRQLMPPWFPAVGQAPVIDAVLTGVATLLASTYALIAYARAQTRIATAYGPFLDLVAWDYFGGVFLRYTGEADAAFRARILQQLILPRVTRQAIQSALQTLTGYKVRVIEAWSPADVGVLGTIYLDVDNATTPGRITDPSLLCQFFIECVLPLTQPYGNNAMPALNQNIYLDASTTGYIFDPEPGSSAEQIVYDFVNAMRAAGVICWLRFVPAPTTPYWDEPGATWDATGNVWS